jgi:hypothetical protein
MLRHSGLAEAGVAGNEVLEGAAAATSLSLPYCRYLLTALLDSVTGTEDASLDQPQLNMFTVFAETWHAASLARLSDADIANVWRLTDYLMLDAACVGCLEDVSVQRQARSNVANRLITASLETVNTRLKAITEALSELPFPQLMYHVARGVSVPADNNRMAAAMWGHWDLLQQARAAGAAWNKRTASSAAYGGHLHLLRQLRQAGCPWDTDVVDFATAGRHYKLAVWALENGAPISDDLLPDAARSACLPVLQWACANKLLPNDRIPTLRKQAHAAKHRDVVTWLDSLLTSAVVTTST